jgi:phospholipase C
MVFAEAAAGNLPGFCLVEPDYGNQSEENPQNIAAGEQFAAKVVNAVMNGPGWETTLLIWTYDEHGGYYDHVPPPRAIPPDDANANTMLDMLDLRPAFLHPPALAQPLADTDPSALACNVTGPGTIPPPGSVSPPRH